MFYSLVGVILSQCMTLLNLILVPPKEHLHRRTFGKNDSLKGAYFSKTKSAKPIDGHYG